MAELNDGKSFMSYDAACEHYGLTRKGLRVLIRLHGLTTYHPVAFDRRHYLRRDALESVTDPEKRDDARTTPPIERTNGTCRTGRPHAYE